MSTAPRSRRGFKVAIFCALPLEVEAVQSILDTCWEDLDKEYGKEVGDQNTYTTGVIGKHNVVLVHMPSMGIANAGLSAAGLRSSFPGVQLALVVGICGVVPIHTQTQEEIVLGDVIISTAVIQYDFGRQFPNEFKRKSAIEDSLGRANPEIRGFLNRLQTRPTRRRWITKLAELARSSSFQKQARTAEYPGASLDRLFEASYTHQHRPHMDCGRCHDNHEVCSQSCDALGCEEGKTIIRNRHVFPQAEDLASLPFGTPFVHLGRFGSANTVMKSGMDRDRLAATDEIIAFEMEGAGVWEQYPTVVIKAACDYADSHKNKKWQSYAAATAAACLKVFLNEWVIPDSPADQG
jgi:nucleoside phosphorylase